MLTYIHMYVSALLTVTKHTGLRNDFKRSHVFGNTFHHLHTYAFEILLYYEYKQHLALEIKAIPFWKRKQTLTATPRQRSSSSSSSSSVYSHWRLLWYVDFMAP